jgi:16S rRNA G527 N7-methylase RsmG
MNIRKDRFILTEINSKDIALSYLKTLKLNPSKGDRQFWSLLKERNDKKLVDRLIAEIDSRAEGSKSDDLYSIKNNNLQLSLDFANYSADMYRRYFEWFLGRASSQPNNLLDIGCDNGIVTCYYSKLFPNAKIIGIDTNKEGIQCAIELAQQLSIPNVNFLHGDIRNIETLMQDASFDVITSLRSLHECVGEFPELGPHWTTLEILTEKSNSQIQELLGIINKLLRDEKSGFISCERLPGLDEIAQWVKELEAADLHIDWNEAANINFHELGNKQQMPVFVSRKQKTSLGPDELLEKLFEFAVQEKTFSINANMTYMGVPAEIIMVQTKDKTLIKGVEIRFLDGTDTLRLELWKHKDLLLIHKYSRQTGYRELIIVSEDEQEEIISGFQEALQRYSGQDIKFYQDT